MSSFSARSSESVVEEMRENVSAKEHERLVRLDIDFHDQIYAAAGNRRLLEAWHALRSQVYLFQLARIRLDDNDYRTRMVTEHWKLATLLRKRDAKTLAKIAEEHVHSARSALVAKLLNG